MGICYSRRSGPAQKREFDVLSLPQGEINKLTEPTDMLKGRTVICRWPDAEIKLGRGTRKTLYDGDTAFAVFAHPVTGEQVGYSVRFNGFDAGEMKPEGYTTKTAKKVNAMDKKERKEYYYGQYTKYALKELGKFHRQCLRQVLTDPKYITKMKILKRDKYGRVLGDVHYAKRGAGVDFKMTEATSITQYMIKYGSKPYGGKTKNAFTLEDAKKWCKICTYKEFAANDYKAPK